MKHYYPDFDQFNRLTAQGNTIPVYRQLMADALTPVTAYRRLAGAEDSERTGSSFLLESVVGGEQIARYSFVGVDPEASFTACTVATPTSISTSLRSLMIATMSAGSGQIARR